MKATGLPGAPEPSGPPSATGNRRYLFLELVVLFAIVPALFLVGLSRSLKVAVIIAAFTYVAVQTIRLRLIPRTDLWTTRLRDWKIHILLFCGFAVVTTVTIALYDPALLFRPPRQRPRLWIMFLVIYSVLSVYPQTLVFRGYFIERYRVLFRNQTTLVVVNAVLFAWAHTIIAHPLVYVLSFCGGMLFTVTYLRSRSLLVTAIEHALYGAWLFTVGMGAVFAFPL